MNLSIYIKLWVANALGKVKIKPTYKHIQFMTDENFVSAIRNGMTKIDGYPFPTYGDEYTITSSGKKAMWSQGNLLITRLISWLALMVSLTALLINYLKP